LRHISAISRPALRARLNDWTEETLPDAGADYRSQLGPKSPFDE
jgi:hypothetical protein